MLENSVDSIVHQIWDRMKGDLLEKLDGLREGLGNWAKGIKDKRHSLKDQLTKKIDRLAKEDQTDDILA